MNKGIGYGLLAYTAWGLLPLYWKALTAVTPLEILSHRMSWSLVFLALILTWRGQWGWLRPALRQRRTVLLFLTTAVLLSINWGTYIWAVNSGHIVESSLGYFINPLINVLLGTIFLRERLTAWQMVAVASATAGVLYLTISYGRLPWIALTLAFSFGTYGLLRKTAPLESLPGLTLETGLLCWPALAYLLWLQSRGTAVFLHTTLPINLLLILAGVATALPLLWFGTAARLVTLTTLGIMQYIAPTLQFLIGVLIYGEAFSRSQLIGFSFIWLALLIYTADRARQSRQHQSARP